MTLFNVISYANGARYTRRIGFCGGCYISWDRREIHRAVTYLDSLGCSIFAASVELRQIGNWRKVIPNENPHTRKIFIRNLPCYDSTSKVNPSGQTTSKNGPAGCRLKTAMDPSYEKVRRDSRAQTIYAFRVATFRTNILYPRRFNLTY